MNKMMKFGKSKGRLEQTDVEDLTEDIWLRVNCHSNTNNWIFVSVRLKPSQF